MTDNIFKNKQIFFDRWAPNYDFLLTTVFYQAVHKCLLEYVKLPERPNVLDLGCGTGRLLNRLCDRFSDLKGTGLDLSMQMLHQARQRNQHHPQLIFVRGNAESLPFADNQFDAVFNTISFLHYPNPERVFAEIARVLHHQGQFYLVDWAFDRLGFPGFSQVDIRFYTPQQREQLGSLVGLTCLGHHYLLSRVLLSVYAIK
jgi:ubiquinone/menaquinone biosynthesis C-methylase UbiE